MDVHQMNKDKWVEVFRAIGMSDEMMLEWHKEFESRFPDEHDAFLKWLKISDSEIESIRALSNS